MMKHWILVLLVCFFSSFLSATEQQDTTESAIKEFITLCSRGKVGTIARMLKKNPPFMQAVDKAPLDQSAIHVVCLEQQLCVLPVLLQHKARFDTRDSKGWSAIHYATLPLEPGFAETLLNARANVDARDNEGNTPLHLAALHDRVDTAELLIARKAAINARTIALQTPLHIAVKKGHFNVIKLLLSLDCSALFAQDRATRTPRELLNDVPTENPNRSAMLNDLFHAEHAFLAYQCQNHTEKFLVTLAKKILFEHLVYACNKGAIYIVKAILSKHPTLVIDTTIASHGDQSPLYAACSSGEIRIVNILLRHKAHSNTIDPKTGWTPLHCATMWGHNEIVRTLVIRKANINAQDTMGNTPLHMAALSDNDLAARILIVHGADSSTKNSNGKTPLETARAVESKSVIASLEGARCIPTTVIR